MQIMNSPAQTLPLEKRDWRLKTLLLCHILGGILLTSLFWQPTYAFWHAIDVSFFQMINSSLQDRPMWQLFWAAANHKLADWIEDFVFLIFFFYHVKSYSKMARSRKIGELVFCLLYSAAIIYFINRLLLREHCNIPRLSPTLSLDNVVHLSDEIPWLSIKDSSSKSFPGDHGTTAILFATILSLLSRKRIAILACLYAAFLCLPRLITGAHWLSDVLVGSGCIVLISLSWAFCTPLFARFCDLWEKMFKAIRK